MSTTTQLGGQTRKFAMGGHYIKRKIKIKKIWVNVKGNKFSLRVFEKPLCFTPFAKVLKNTQRGDVPMSPYTMPAGCFDILVSRSSSTR